MKTEQEIAKESRLPCLWTRSYYCESIGHISEATIKKHGDWILFDVMIYLGECQPKKLYICTMPQFASQPQIAVIVC